MEPPTAAPTSLSISCQYSSQFDASPNNGSTSPSDNGMKVGSVGGFFNSQHGMVGGGGSGGVSGSGLPQAPRQKGRPRKRKPKDIESMTSNLGKW